MALVCIVAGLGSVLVLTRSSAWERQHRGEIAALVGRAESLAVDGRLREAFEQYHQVLGLVGERALADRSLRDLVERARADQDRVFQALLLPRAGAASADRTGRSAEAAPTSAPAPAATQPKAMAIAPPPATKPTTALAQRPSEPTAPATHPTTLVVVPPPPQPAPIEHPKWVLPPHTPEAADPDALSDERIGLAIQRMADQLIDAFDPATHEVRSGMRGRDNAYHAGVDALCVYALLQAGQAIPDQRLDVRGDFMKGLLKKLRELPMTGGPVTYARSLRATALAVYNRPEDRETIKSDVGWLVQAQRNGAYTYDFPRAGPLQLWDNSNSQYGALGIWSGCEVGVEVPAFVWEQIERHWSACQLENGQWGYGDFQAGGGSVSMTAAGVASLFVAHDYLNASKYVTELGAAPFPPALAHGLAWLEEGDHAVALAGFGHRGYTLYGIERVGLASGFKYFGTHDWYRELARKILDEQAARAAWRMDIANAGPDALVDTAYRLLFLSRGRHPVMLNKLRVEPERGFWANRPRDAANLARYASHQLERPLNWQVVSFGKDYSDWMDCPVLYLASHQPLKLDEEQIDQLRQYVYAGGMLFTQSDGGSEAFNKYVAELSQKLFPAYELRDLPATHELYSLVYPVGPKPPLKAVSNGTRILLLHSPTDISMHWQQRAEKSKKNVFDLGVNLFLYASGKSDLRNRLTSPYLPAPIQPAAEKLKLARVRYGGNWDPEPGAYVRFTRYLQRQTGLGLQYETVLMKDLPTCGMPVAHLTGTAVYTPSDSEIAAIKQYVEAGGILVIDSAGGETAFADSVRTILARAFPSSSLQSLPPDHPLLSGDEPGMDDLRKPQLRPYSHLHFGGTAACPLQLLHAGKGSVLFSPLDITCGLLGTHTWAIHGFTPDYAQSLLKNAILWTAYGTPTAPAHAAGF